MPRTVTLWQRLVIVAFLMEETMTGVCPPLLFGSAPPNCAKPVPFSWSAVMMNSWPETEMLDASAPSAVSPTSVAATTAAGIATMANRRQLTLPRAELLLLPTDMTLPLGCAWCASGPDRTGPGRRHHWRACAGCEAAHT